MAGAINQIQMSYDAEEDRILFRLNTSNQCEFRFWLTRRYVLLLLKVLRDHLARDPDVLSQSNHEAKQAVKTYKQEQAVSNADFSKKFADDAKEYPLGEKGVLAYKLSFTFQEENMNLCIEPKDDKGINLAVNPELNISLTQLILSAVKQGEWQIDHLPIASSPDTGEKRVIN